MWYGRKMSTGVSIGSGLSDQTTNLCEHANCPAITMRKGVKSCACRYDLNVCTAHSKKPNVLLIEARHCCSFTNSIDRKAAAAPGSAFFPAREFAKLSGVGRARGQPEALRL